MLFFKSLQKQNKTKQKNTLRIYNNEMVSLVHFSCFAKKICEKISINRSIPHDRPQTNERKWGRKGQKKFQIGYKTKIDERT